MIKEAAAELYPQFPYEAEIKYSGKFKPYNANVKLFVNPFGGGTLQFHLSSHWKSVSREIQIGLLQDLLLKILKKRLKPYLSSTSSIEIYHIFMKKLHLAAPKDHVEPQLLGSFQRVNEAYFSGMIELTNLEWGTDSFSLLGRYAYGSDTITISRALSQHQELLDFVMYHEMLHKKHKYTQKNGKSFHHSKAFRADEQKFEHYAELEKKLARLPRKRSFSPFF
ncbi:M48 family metallopeptidase [Candidatus Woesearchaeota archaeon]|nr:M48 family metallopeptidase [Candidatus Woesearchaeota archaeon]